MVELPNESALRELYAAGDTNAIARRIEQQFKVSLAPPGVVGLRLPSFDIGPAALDPDVPPDPQAGPHPDVGEIRAALPSLVVVIEAGDPQQALRYVRAFRQAGGSAGADPVIGQLEHWVPGGDRPPLFHTRAAAEALINASVLGNSLRGERTNLVVFDEGVSFAALRARSRSPRPLRLAGGWPVAGGGTVRVPGQARPDGHGSMVAFNAVSLAPDARLWDLPFLPDQILAPVAFASDAAVALRWVETEIRLWLSRAFPGPWVFCHAWGIYDRRLEVPYGSYTGDPLHPLNQRVQELDQGGRDQVFGAGNCGQFAPHPRCGPGDTGPGRSILGANSSPSVLTMGAVRADGMWIGYSSQGPGQSAFGSGGRPVEKPDLCAPSHFVETTDGAWLSSGTSAACGVAAGAVAALRSAGSPLANVDPEALRCTLRQAARKPPDMRHGAGYDIRYGHGILDLAGALASAAGQLPQASVVHPPVTPAPAPQPLPAPVALSSWGRLFQRLRNWLRLARPG